VSAGAVAFDAGAGRALHTPTMQVKLNGEIREVPEGISVAALLAQLGVKAQRVAVEVNEAVVTKDRYEAHALRGGDAVEIVAFVGGG
jgi:sulfur carrier protein